MKEKTDAQVEAGFYKRLEEESYFAKRFLRRLYRETAQISECKEIVPSKIETPPNFSSIETRGVNKSKRNIAQDTVDNMLEMGYIERTVQSPNWLIPSIFIRKKSTEEVILALDLRRVNSVVEKDEYPLPSIKKQISHLTSARYYSRFTIKDGLFKVPLDPSSYEKTTFKVEGEYYRFKVLPIGYINSHTRFQKIMDSILKEEAEKTCSIYLFDVLVYSCDLHTHGLSLLRILRKLKEYGLDINWETAEFGKKEIEFRGKSIKEGFIKPDEKKLEFALNFYEPETLKDLRRYLGAVGINRKFVPDSSETLKPLYTLARGLCPFNWRKQHSNAFFEYQMKLSNITNLAVPDVSKNFIIETTVLYNSISATLKQEDEVIEYYSKTMCSWQKKYSRKEKQAFAVLSAVKRWGYYLKKTNFTVISSFAGLSNLEDVIVRSNISNRMRNWCSILNSYSIAHVLK